MKSVLVVYFICQFLTGMSQITKPPIEYAGGNEQFSKYLMKHVKAPAIEDRTDSGNSYFSILIDFDNTGKIDHIDITYLKDSIIAIQIDSLIQNTNGQWTNHSGSGVLGVITFFFEYIGLDNIEEKRMPKIDWVRYNNRKKVDTYNFGFIHVMIYPPNRERKISVIKTLPAIPW